MEQKTFTKKEKIVFFQKIIALIIVSLFVILSACGRTCQNVEFTNPNTLQPETLCVVGK